MELISLYCRPIENMLQIYYIGFIYRRANWCTFKYNIINITNIIFYKMLVRNTISHIYKIHMGILQYFIIITIQ